MKNLIAILIFTLPINLFAAQEEIEAPKEFTEILRRYEKAWEARDAISLSGLFAEDGFVLSNYSVPVRGRENIQEFYKGRGGALYLRVISWAKEGTIGYMIGAYASSEDGPDLGKFTLTLKKNENGTWEIFSDMDNSDRRPRKQIQQGE